jgi:hypothetical protein
VQAFPDEANSDEAILVIFLAGVVSDQGGIEIELRNERE